MHTIHELSLSKSLFYALGASSITLFSCLIFHNKVGFATIIVFVYYNIGEVGWSAARHRHFKFNSIRRISFVHY